jgi:hypothetical protein
MARKWIFFINDMLKTYGLWRSLFWNIKLKTHKTVFVGWFCGATCTKTFSMLYQKYNHLIKYTQIPNLLPINFNIFPIYFGNLFCISWRSVLLVEETGVPGENHRPVASHWQTLSHNVVHLALIEIRTHNIGGNLIYNWSYIVNHRPSWPWSYGSWICNYLCNECLLPPMLWVRISISARCTTLWENCSRGEKTIICLIHNVSFCRWKIKKKTR